MPSRVEVNAPSPVKVKGSAEKAQGVFSNLVRAIQNGAFSATYADNSYVVYSGPVIDKDELPEVVDRYAQLLKENGVKGKNHKRAVQIVETLIYDGNPEATVGTVARLREIVKPRR